MEYEQLICFLKKYGSITEQDEANIKKYFVPIKVHKREVLINQQSICNKLFFVNKGLLRAYYTNDKGKELTRMIAWEGSFLTNIVSFKNFSENNETIECIEDAELLSIDRDGFGFLIQSSSNLKSIYLDIIEEYAAVHAKRFQVINTFTLNQKFEYLKADYPHLIMHVKDNILASFLGISREYFVKNKPLLWS